MLDAFEYYGIRKKKITESHFHIPFGILKFPSVYLKPTLDKLIDCLVDIVHREKHSRILISSTWVVESYG
jgi:hypothetical protein